MTTKNIAPLVAIVGVAAVLIGLVYANVTGMLALSGAKVVDKNTATIIVAVLFVAMLPWAYKRSQAS